MIWGQTDWEMKGVTVKQTKHNEIPYYRSEWEGNTGGRRDEEKKERKEQFAVNVCGSKSQPNGWENEWCNGESAERSFAVMTVRMDERELREIINCKDPAHHFPGITAFNSRYC